jgi:hypothetical protein
VRGRRGEICPGLFLPPPYEGTPAKRMVSHINRIAPYASPGCATLHWMPAFEVMAAER